MVLFFMYFKCGADYVKVQQCAPDGKIAIHFYYDDDLYIYMI